MPPLRSALKAAVSLGVRVAGIGIDHPERVIAEAPGHTKLDVVRYHERIGAWLLPQLAPRPIAPPCARESAPPFIRVADVAGVVRAVRNGHYEFRTWGASFPRLERPDRMLFELAAGDDLPWASMRDAAQHLRALLESIDLPAFVKTTGGSGLDVVVAVTRRHTWPEIADFARAVAHHLVRRHPTLFAAAAVPEHAERVVVDVRANDMGEAAVAAYALRACAGLPVSMPIAWSDLAGADLRDRHFGIDSAPAFVASRSGDPWAAYECSRRTISAAMRRALTA